MRYNFEKMDADSFELMVRSLNQETFGIKCEQYGMGPDGQREFVYEGTIKDKAGNLFEGRTFGQVKYKYPNTKQSDYVWLKSVLKEELDRFRKKDKKYRPDNYFFYTNIVLTPAKDTGIKDKIEKFLKEENDIIPHIYIKGYDDICALLDTNRDVATAYAAHILSGDVLMELLSKKDCDYSVAVQRFLAREFEEDMYTRMEQAGSVTERKVSIEKVCVDIDVIERIQKRTMKFAERVAELGNGVLGYRKEIMGNDKDNSESLKRDENFVLIGGPGRGKTTICQFIAQMYRANYLNETRYGTENTANYIKEIEVNYGYHIKCLRIPFKITLREYAAWLGRQGKDDNISVIQYMGARIKKVTGEELSIPTIRKMICEMSWIFFFDGLDEVPESSNRTEVLKQIETFISVDLREAKCDCMIIATSRLQGYNNDFDESRYEHLEVAELSKQDCEKYVKKLFEVMEEQIDKREEYVEIMREALEDDTTSRLLKTPLQATIISILVKSGGKPPQERYSLFQQYYETMVRREKQKGVIATLNDHTEWLQEIHFIVADKLQVESEREDNPSAEISKVEFLKLIQRYIKENMDEFYEHEENIEKKAKEFLKIIADRMCFLSENREGYYSFSIRTMQEYFAGTHLVKGVSDDEAMKNIRKIVYKSYWRNALLFALGYIELEKKNLEEDIGSLCTEMNGRDNLMKDEYTAENICLFGSWLALDILSENIFKGKKQNKYIELVTRLLPYFTSSYYNKFAFLTGVQQEKVCAYVMEKYQNKREYREQVFSLYMKLNENEKNNMENDIDRLLDKCGEDEEVLFCIKILEDDVRFDETWILKWEKRLVEFVTHERVLQFLPYKVLLRLFKYCSTMTNTNLRRFMFIQCLYNEQISSDNLAKMFEEECLKEISFWLSRNHHENDDKMHKITADVEFRLRNFIPAERCIDSFRKFSVELGLEYFIKLCDYIKNPSYLNFTILHSQLEKEPPYLIKKYKECLIYQAPTISEEEYKRYQYDKEMFYRLFNGGMIREYMKCDVCPGLGYAVACNDSALDKLLEDEDYGINSIGELSNVFLEAYLFVANVQLDGTYGEDISDVTLQNYLLLLKEVNKRKMKSYQVYVILIELLASDYRNHVYEEVPSFDFLEDRVRKMGTLNYFAINRYFSKSEKKLDAVVFHVVQEVVHSLKESNYLQLLPLVLYKNIDCSQYISERELKVLDKISYQCDMNKLVVELLKIYCGKGDELLIERMFDLNVSKRLIYTWLVNAICNCKISNTEMLGVKVYLMLQEEEFEQSRLLREKLYELLMERRTDAIGS